MKTLLPFILLLGLSLAAFTQNRKVTVFCRLSASGKVEYGNLRSCLTSLMPDSALAQMLITPDRKKMRMDDLDGLTLITAAGWKLSSVETNVSGTSGSTSSASSYLFEREIELSDQNYDIFLKRLSSMRAGSVY